MKVSLITLSVLFPFFIWGQSEDLRIDSTFFNQQLITYQSWLNDTGLGEKIKTDGLRISKNKLTVKLIFNVEARDSAVYTWKRIKSDYEETTGFSLEDRLFLKMTHLMEITPEQAMIRIKNIPAPGEVPIVDGRIVYDKKKKVIAPKGFSTRSEKVDSIFIRSFTISEKYTLIDTLRNNDTLNEQQIANLYLGILSTARTHFQIKVDSQNITPLARQPYLIFEVKNIKEEVVPASYISIMNPHELLRFSIQLKNTNSGVLMTCIVDGKYGSGLFKPRTLNGFREMNPEFEEELQRYTSNFTQFIIPEWFN